MTKLAESNLVLISNLLWLMTGWKEETRSSQKTNFPFTSDDICTYQGLTIKWNSNPFCVFVWWRYSMFCESETFSASGPQSYQMFRLTSRCDSILLTSDFHSNRSLRGYTSPGFVQPKGAWLKAFIPTLSNTMVHSSWNNIWGRWG